jgi:hypothetical protein
MNEYMIFVNENDHATAADAARVMEGRAAYTAQLKKSGALLDGERLRTSNEGRRVLTADGKVRVEKGPFQDTVASYWTVKAKDLDSAVALAKQLPVLPNESVEVRPVMKGQYDPTKSDKTGKLFAFAVLGNAPNEEAWIHLMDRIDNDTNDKFPPGMVGGVRLEAPRTGRRLVNQHGKTVVLDGPFLESKEVIGGLFFCRMTSLEDAVEWVSSTAFVRIGGAEIREVWRS